MRILKIVGVIIAAVVFICWLSGSSEQASGPPSQEQVNEQHEIAVSAVRPEELVMLSDKIVACSSKDLVKEFEDHVSSGEKTKAEAMFDDLSCFVVGAQEQPVKFKVLSVVGSIWSGEYAEITADADASSGMWVNVNSIDHIIK